MRGRNVVLLTVLLGMCFISPLYAEKQIMGQVDARQYGINLGLGRVEQLYVMVELDGRVASKDGVKAAEIENAIKEHLSEICPEISIEEQKAADEKLQQMIDEKVGVAGKVKVRSIDTPELIVRISTKVYVQQVAAFHVQSSFAKKVYMRASPRATAKAEVWRVDVPIISADANSLADAVRTETLRQVDAFVEDWKRANTSRVAFVPQDDSDTTTSTQEQIQKKVPENKESQHPYVASKNSKVFHKAGCRSADRINPENLIGFNSREEAINSGRRPCKMCKP